LRRAAQAVDAQMLDYIKAHALAGSFAAGERIVVAINEMPSAPELVRAAKRLADALRAPWTALHVETRRTGELTEAEREHLNGTIALAAQLGAATATIPAASVVDGLVAFAREARATQVVIGKSSRSWWFELRQHSIVDRLVRDMSTVAVHVLPAERGALPPARGRPRKAGSWGKPHNYLSGQRTSKLASVRQATFACGCKYLADHFMATRVGNAAVEALSAAGYAFLIILPK